MCVRAESQLEEEANIFKREAKDKPASPPRRKAKTAMNKSQNTDSFFLLISENLSTLTINTIPKTDGAPPS